MGYVIILNIEWLKKYGMTLDCERRLVTLVDEKGKKLELYYGNESLIMVSYLCSLDLPKDGLACVPSANDYPDVFEEVNYLPPYRET